jgi:hypothetical protein
MDFYDCVLLVPGIPSGIGHVTSWSEITALTDLSSSILGLFLDQVYPGLLDLVHFLQHRSPPWLFVIPVTSGIIWMEFFRAPLS